MDIGVYCVHPAIVLFGKPLEVKANGLILESGADGEGTLPILCRLRSMFLKFGRNVVFIASINVTRCSCAVFTISSASLTWDGIINISYSERGK